MTIADNTCKCGSTTSPKVKVVRGNDLVIEAKASLWSEESRSYEAYSLDGAAGLKMYLVGDYGRVECADVAADGATARGKVCGRALGRGVYGVELTFGDEGGHGRIYEAGVLEIVESGEEATTVSTAEGEGVPFTVEVDMTVRTVRFGKVAATDSYDALTGKPRVEGRTLSGEMTLSDFGAAAAADIPTKVSQLDNDRGYLTEHQSLADYAKTADVDAALADKAGKADFDAEVSAREATDANVTAVSGRVGTLNNAVNKQGVAIASVRDRVSAVEAGLSEKADKELGGRVDGNTAAISTLNSDSNTEGSVKKTVADAIALVVAGAPADFDTLKEIADYIAADKTGAAQMAAALSQLQSLTKAHTDGIAANKEDIAANKEDIAANASDIKVLQEFADNNQMMVGFDDATGEVYVGLGSWNTTFDSGEIDEVTGEVTLNVTS